METIPGNPEEPLDPKINPIPAASPDFRQSTPVIRET